MKNDMIHMYNIQNCCKNRDVKDRLILPQEFCLPQDKIRNLQKVHKLGKEMRWIFCRKKIRIKGVIQSIKKDFGIRQYPSA